MLLIQNRLPKSCTEIAWLIVCHMFICTAIPSNTGSPHRPPRLNPIPLFFLSALLPTSAHERPSLPCFACQMSHLHCPLAAKTSSVINVALGYSHGWVNDAAWTPFTHGDHRGDCEHGTEGRWWYAVHTELWPYFLFHPCVCTFCSSYRSLK